MAKDAEIDEIHHAETLMAKTGVNGSAWKLILHIIVCQKNASRCAFETFWDETKIKFKICCLKIPHSKSI